MSTVNGFESVFGLDEAVEREFSQFDSELDSDWEFSYERDRNLSSDISGSAYELKYCNGDYELPDSLEVSEEIGAERIHVNAVMGEVKVEFEDGKIEYNIIQSPEEGLDEGATITAFMADNPTGLRMDGEVYRLDLEEGTVQEAEQVLSDHTAFVTEFYDKVIYNEPIEEPAYRLETSIIEKDVEDSDLEEEMRKLDQKIRNSTRGKDREEVNLGSLFNRRMHGEFNPLLRHDFGQQRALFIEGSRLPELEEGSIVGLDLIHKEDIGDLREELKGKKSLYWAKTKL